MRFYVAFSADCGWALMSSHDIIEADNQEDALATWVSKVSGAVAYKEQGPDACFKLAASMVDWPKDKILDHYRDTEFGDRRSAVMKATPMYSKVPHWRTFYHAVAPEDETLMQSVTSSVVRKRPFAFLYAWLFLKTH